MNTITLKIESLEKKLTQVKSRKNQIAVVWEIVKLERLLDKESNKLPKYVKKEGNKLIVATPYNTAFLAEFKNEIHYKERSWNGNKKAWEVGYSLENLEILNNLISEYFCEETEEIRIAGLVSSSAKRTYLGNITIDGNALYWLNTGNLNYNAKNFEIVKVFEDEFSVGDRNHAFEKTFDLIIRCRKGAEIKRQARCCKAWVEII